MAQPSSSKSVIFPVFAAVFLIVVAVGAFFYIKTNVLDRNTNKVRIGFTGETLEAISIIAQQNKYFAGQGLEVELVSYDTGKLALENGLLKGEVDIAPVANAPSIVSFMNGEPVRSLGVMGRADDQLKILARKSAGIREIQDIAGKRVLTQKGSAAHYFFSLFLDANNISSDDVVMVYDDSVKSFPDMMKQGKADIVIIKEPIFSAAKQMLGDDAVEFKAGRIFFKTFVYITNQHFIDRNPQTLEKLMQALYEAEQYIQQSPQEAKQTVMSYPGMKQETVNSQWNTQNIELVIDDIYRNLSEEQAIWALSNKLTETDRSKEIDSYIYDVPLRKVKPQGVY